MRILGFSLDWPKLRQEGFTTFRIQRRDRDWAVGEIVQVKLKPRSKGGGVCKGIAKITAKETKDSINIITDQEAIRDGFENKAAMWRWLIKAHSSEQLCRPLNKLTLKWINHN